MIIVMKKLMNPIFISTISPKVGIQVQNQTSKIKLLITKCSYCNIPINYFVHQHHITSIDKKVRYLTAKSNTFISSRAMSGQGDRNFNIDFTEILKAQNNKNILIIDVRENVEIQETGKLPGSIHIPMGEIQNVFTNLTHQEFEERFHRKKPDPNTKIIVSCRSGKRSVIIQSDIQKLGYKNVYNYVGGWLDWENHQV